MLRKLYCWWLPEVNARSGVLLSSTYFLYFGILGVLTPFLSLFLDFRGFNSVQIGQALAVITATRIIAPSLWAAWADRTGKQVRVIRIGAAAGAGFVLLAAFAEAPITIVFLLAMLSLFWTGILPQLEVVTNNTVHNSTLLYSRIRSGGSIGFIALVVFTGQLFDLFSAKVFPWILFALMCLLLWCGCLLRDPEQVEHQSALNGKDFKQELFSRGFVMFFLSMFLLQVSFGPFYAFFSLFIKQLGYSSFLVGIFISIGVVAEIVMFMWVSKVIAKLGVYYCILGALVLTAIRWLSVGLYGEQSAVLVLSQLTHAASFALVHASAIAFINNHFQQKNRGKAQAIYIGGSYSGGGALGALISGYLWADGAGAQQTFVFAAIAAALAAIVYVFSGERRKNIAV